jgi:hypothetical protein
MKRCQHPIDPAKRVIDERWAARIRELLRPPAEKLLSTSVYEIIKAEGFDGSYVTVARFVRDMRGPRFRAAPAVSVPIETAPAEKCQFDWSDCSAWNPGGTQQDHDRHSTVLRRLSGAASADNCPRGDYNDPPRGDDNHPARGNHHGAGCGDYDHGASRSDTTADQARTGTMPQTPAGPLGPGRQQGQATANAPKQSVVSSR